MNPPKVCLVAPGWLPVPATGGGAVESLMTTIAECNERVGLLDLTVVTRMDDASSHAAARFGTTRFVPIADAARPVVFWDHWYGALTRRIIPGYVPSNSYQRNVARLIDPADFDAIVLEAGPLPVPNVTAKRFSDRLWYHLHHVIDAPVSNNAYRHVIGVSDFACDRFRSLCRNAADPHRRAAMGAAALVRAQEFSRERFYHRFADALRRDCERHRDRSQSVRPAVRSALQQALQQEGRQ